jgi:hypothetical protein
MVTIRSSPLPETSYLRAPGHPDKANRHFVSSIQTINRRLGKWLQ